MIGNGCIGIFGHDLYATCSAVGIEGYLEIIALIAGTDENALRLVPGWRLVAEERSQHTGIHREWHAAAGIYAKLEGNNPGGSVKDRAAYGMIKGAFDRGELKDGIKLVEATSGNTGIALAMIASLFKVKIELIMPEDPDHA